MQKTFAFRRLIAPVLFVGLSFGSLGLASAQEPAADNTKVNKDANQPTADQQKESRSDLDITQQIRKAIIAEKSLSTYAHNVKIITQNGMVTLKGPVRTEEEKTTVQAKAAEVAGAQNVTSQIAVQPKN